MYALNEEHVTAPERLCYSRYKFILHVVPSVPATEKLRLVVASIHSWRHLHLEVGLCPAFIGINRWAPREGCGSLHCSLILPAGFQDPGGKDPAFP